jgi:hypothetical protein
MGGVLSHKHGLQALTLSKDPEKPRRNPMALTLLMFLPFIATFGFASWHPSSSETRSRDYQRGRNSLCEG